MDSFMKRNIKEKKHYLTYGCIDRKYGDTKGGGKYLRELTV